MCSKTIQYSPITVLRSLLLLVGFSILYASCSSDADKDRSIDEQHFMSRLESANMAFLEIEKQEINDFINRYNWDMNETGSGLHYHIYAASNGISAEVGKTAVIQYDMYLLNGDLVYSSETEGNKTFQIGQGGVESGLEEAILLLRLGDKARFILPAHLAHGVPGDGVKIPRQAAILYDVHLLELNHY